MAKSAMKVLLVVVFCGSTFGLDIVSSGYSVQTYTTYSESGIGGISDMTFDDEGNLYATHRFDDSIWRTTPAGTASEFVSGFGVRGIDWGGGTTYGNYLYAPDAGVPNGEIRRIDKSGTISTFATFGSPKHGLDLAAIDRTGNYGGLLYTATKSIDHTYSVDTSGNISMFSDFPGQKNGGGPREIAFDTTGNFGSLMYISTSFNNISQC